MKEFLFGSAIATMAVGTGIVLSYVPNPFVWKATDEIEELALKEKFLNKLEVFGFKNPVFLKAHKKKLIMKTL